MRRYTVWVTEKEYHKLRETAEKVNLQPQDFLNFATAKMLGAKVPEKKKKWAGWMATRKIEIQSEPQRAERIGQGERQVDLVYRTLSRYPDMPMSASEIAERTKGLNGRRVPMVLKKYPEYFEALNAEGRKPYEPLMWSLVSDHRTHE